MRLDERSIDFKPPKTNNITVLIAQSQFDPKQFYQDENELYQLEFNDHNKNFIQEILVKATEENVDLVVFPELAIPSELHNSISMWTQDNIAIVVAGSTYLQRDGKFYNTASLFYQGEQHKREKIILSPHEISGRYQKGPTAGQNIYYLENTPVGTLGILICSEFFDMNLLAKISEIGLDILCLIACQNDSTQYYQQINQLVKNKESGLYVLYCNMLCMPYSDGGSALFAQNHRVIQKKASKVGLTDKDDYDTKMVRMPRFEGCLIAECRKDIKCAILGDRYTYRYTVNEIRNPFKFKNGSLIMLDDDALKSLNKDNNFEFNSSPTSFGEQIKNILTLKVDSTKFDKLYKLLNESKVELSIDDSLYLVEWLTGENGLSDYILNVKNKSSEYRTSKRDFEFLDNLIKKLDLLLTEALKKEQDASHDSKWAIYKEALNIINSHHADVYLTWVCKWIELETDSSEFKILVNAAQKEYLERLEHLTSSDKPKIMKRLEICSKLIEMLNQE